MNKDEIQVNLSFIDYESKYEQDRDEIISTTRGPVSWGKNNKYPNLLRNLYNNSATLGSIINGTRGYVLGDGVIASENAAKWKDKVNRRGDTPYDVVNALALDYMLYNGFAIQVIYSKLGTVAEIYTLDFSKCRTDEYHKKIYYYKKGCTAYSNKYEEYDAFGAEINPERPTQILYFTDGCRGVYPTPRWESCIKDVETEIEATSYSLNSIANGLSARYILTMPSSSNLTREQKGLIEKGIKDKFTGTETSSNFMVYFATGSEKIEASPIASDDQNEKFVSIKKAARENIFTSFSCVPALFGLMSESKGFSKEEFENSYKLYYATQVKPIQKKINNQVSKALGVENALVFQPLIIDWAD